MCVYIYMCIYIYIYTFTCMCAYVYIYIYRERERGRERDIDAYTYINRPDNHPKVHKIAESFRLFTISSGVGDARFISVYKKLPEGADPKKGQGKGEGGGIY